MGDPVTPPKRPKKSHDSVRAAAPKQDDSYDRYNISGYPLDLGKQWVDKVHLLCRFRINRQARNASFATTLIQRCLPLRKQFRWKI